MLDERERAGGGRATGPGTGTSGADKPGANKSGADKSGAHGPTAQQHDWVRDALGVDPRLWRNVASSVADAVGGFAKGVGEGVVDGTVGVVKSTATLVKDAGVGAYHLATDPHARERAGQRIAGAAHVASDFAHTAVSDPARAASEVGHGLKAGAHVAGHLAQAAVDGYRDAAAHGHGAEFVGKAVGQGGVLVAGALIPGVGEAEGAAVAVDGVSVAGRVVRAGEAVGDAARAGEIAEEAAHVERAASLGAKAARDTVRPVEPTPPRPVGGVDPATLEKAKQDLAPLMREAEGGKAMIDAAADATAAQFGGVVRKAPIKSLDRAAEKVARDYGGDARKIKDLARNTIIVPPENTQAVIDDIVAKLKVPANRIKLQKAETDPLGYSGAIINVPQPNGMLAEIQVNSPEMIYAKDAESVAEKTLGTPVFNAIKQATGMEGGRGHTLYEAWRSLPLLSPDAARIEADSKRYYDAIRKGAAHIDWRSVLR